MPRRVRPGEWSIIYAEVPTPLRLALERRAVEERRSLTAELIRALEAHLGIRVPPQGKPKKGGA